MLSPPRIRGDLDGNGEVTSVDAVIALRAAAGSREYDSDADVNGDGRATALDGLMIMQAAGGRITI